MLFKLSAGYPFYRRIGIAELFSGKICFVAEIVFKLLFHSDKVKELVEEPLVYHSYLMYLVNAHAAAESLVYNEKPFIIAVVQLSSYLLIGEVSHFR